MSEFRFLRPRSSPQNPDGAIIRGFNIVKAFIELGTYNTIESLQALCVNRATKHTQFTLFISPQHEHACTGPSVGGCGSHHDTDLNL